jgi:hypothetical protein
VVFPLPSAQAIPARGAGALRAALDHIADDLAIAHHQGGGVRHAEQRLIGVGDTAAHRLSAVGPRTARTAHAVIEANGTIRDDGDCIEIVVNAAASCYAPCGATGARAALAKVAADRAVPEV